MVAVGLTVSSTVAQIYRDEIKAAVRKLKERAPSLKGARRRRQSDFQGTEPPKVLVLGPDAAGNVLEVIGRFEPEDVLTIFHAMAARPALLRLLQ